VVLTSNLVIFACKFLFIKGCFKLCNVDFDEFSLVSLLTGVVLKFYQGVSKNLWINIIHCFVDQFKLDVDYPVVDVIETFKEFTYHHYIY